ARREGGIDLEGDVGVGGPVARLAAGDGEPTERALEEGEEDRHDELVRAMAEADANDALAFENCCDFVVGEVAEAHGGSLRSREDSLRKAAHVGGLSIGDCQMT